MVMNGIEDKIRAVDKAVYSIRYADDLTIFGNSRACVEKMKKIIEDFLKVRGLTLNEQKTKTVEICEGFNLLGYTIREFKDESRLNIKGKPFKKGIVLSKPSKQAIEKFKAKIKDAVKTYKNGSALKLILKLNPIIRGFGNYFNGGGG
jgi:RNA-directed DNA polymerase